MIAPPTLARRRKQEGAAVWDTFVTIRCHYEYENEAGGTWQKETLSYDSPLLGRVNGQAGIPPKTSPARNRDSDSRGPKLSRSHRDPNGHGAAKFSFGRWSA